MRLSRKYYDASYNDPLLNDLGVHHFHLGKRAKSPKKLCKSLGKDLLFGIVEKDTVYLAHLGDHASFRKIAFEDITFENWPHLFEELKGIMPGSEPWSPEDRAIARHCGLSMMVQFGDKVYMPRWSGQSTAGTSIWVTNMVNSLIHQVRSGQEWIIQRSAWVREGLAKRGRSSDNLTFEVKVSGTAVWFVDQGMGLWICPVRGEMRFAQVPSVSASLLSKEGS